MDSNGQHFELLYNLHTGIVVHRSDTSIVYCNKCAIELLGLTEDQMMGKTALDPTWHVVDALGQLMTPSQYPVSVVIDTQLPIDEMVLGVQSGPNRELIWLLVSAYPQFFPNGSLKQVVVNFYSIQKLKALETTLAATALQIEDLYNNTPCGNYSLDVNGQFLHINATALSWIGATAEELIGKKSALDFLPDEQKEIFIKRYQHFKSTGRVDDVELDIVGKSGIKRRVSVTATAVYDANGNFLMSRSVIYDISTLHQTRVELDRLRLEQDAMLDNDMVGIAKVRDRVAIWKNKALARIFGYEHEELLGKPSRILYKDEHQYETLGRDAYPILAAGGHYRTQLEMRRKDGSPVWIDISGVLLSPEHGFSMWLFSDISELKRYQQRIERLAFHDSLTSLPNRLLFVDRLTQALAVASRNKSFLAVCYLDLDGFKQVNDTYGHAVGDIVLKEIGRRLLTVVRPNDTACRLGGDEFVLLLTYFDSPDEFCTVLDRALIELKKPIAISTDLSVAVSASAGVARYPTEGADVEVLLRNADKAMYQSKANGKNRVCVYTDASC